jgi:p-hydroxybenzoate 3-monooxygenase
MRTQVGILGAGPAGRLLSHLLHLRGIESVVLESRSREYVENRIRAGVLEYPVERLLDEVGVGARMRAEGLVHEGVTFRIDGADHRIDLKALTGKHLMVYSQHKLVQDLIAARLAAGGRIEFEAEGVAIEGADTDRPRIHWRRGAGGPTKILECDFVAGCDGFHGISRPAIPASARADFDRQYPFAWLGVLADAAPGSHELIYVSHARGFALQSMRSPTVSRLYLQCAPDEDLSRWSDDRIWEELGIRMARPGFVLGRGPITQKGVTAMRSFACEPMRQGRLLLAGDAAHIVPPTGAKGLNLAAADVTVMAAALERWFARGDAAGLEAYSDTCLRRVWRTQRFSWWLTGLLHRFDAHSPFERRMQRAELEGLFQSEAQATAFAEAYVGLPLVLG